MQPHANSQGITHSQPAAPRSVGVGDFVVKESFFALTIPAREILGTAPDRVTLVFMPLPGATVTLSTRADVTADLTGLNLASPDLPLVFNVREHAGLVNSNWYGVASVPTTITVIEVFYRPQR